MTSNRVPGRVRTAALLVVLCSSLTAFGADLASTYAHDAFPSAAPSAEPARHPCSQARLARRSRPIRKPVARALRHGTASPELLPSERVERPGVVTNEEDPKHS